MKTFLMSLVAFAAIGCRSDGAPAGGGGEVDRATPVGQSTPAATASGQAAAGDALARAAPEPRPAEVAVAGLGACRADADARERLSRVIDMADANEDGQVSLDEAHAMMNFFIGGLFFRADENADGVITPDEGRKVRADFLAQQPVAAALLHQARGALGESPVAALARLVDVEYGQPLPLAEARATSRNAVASLYKLVDLDHNGSVTVDEAKGASRQAALAMGQAAFRSADADKNGALSQEEFQNVVLVPVRQVYSLADANRDGALTPDEASVALGHLGRRLGVPSLLEEGVTSRTGRR